MVRRSLSSTILLLGLALMEGQPAEANTPLTRAVVSSLRNQVRLLPQSRPARKAKLSDVLTPGDGIVTSRRSLAELRFNDGSLARMGEQAVFRFIPKTRSFRLSNGTVLMLIPPGQGRTQVRTPNVTAGIRGSALIIRYDQVTDTSTVIALTNSQISATNRDATQTQVLAAGQAVVLVGDEITKSYDVDLQELYDTSPLLKHLEMDNPDATVKDEAIAQVREETLEGIRSQRTFIEGEGHNGTQDFRLSELDIDSVIANEMGHLGAAAPNLNTGADSSSGSFPGQAIGVDGRFNQDEETRTTPVFPQPSAVEAPRFEPPPVPQPTFSEPPVAVEQPPVLVEQPPVPEFESPVPVNDSVADGIIDDVDHSIADLPSSDSSVADVATDVGVSTDSISDIGDSIGNDIGGDEIAADVQTPGAINDVGNLPTSIPEFNPTVDALMPDNSGDDSLGDQLSDTPGTDVLVDSPGDMEIEQNVDAIDQGGIDDQAADAIDQGGVDDQAADAINQGGIDDQAANAIDQGGIDDQAANAIDQGGIDDQAADAIDQGEGSVEVDIDTDVTITVIINGQQTVIQGGVTSDALDTSVEEPPLSEETLSESSRRSSGLID